MSDTILMALGFLVTAAVYAAVGQAGASGYLAIMALAGTAPEQMKVTALVLNTLVAGIGTWMFLRAGRLTWRSIWPFAALGFPFSMLGGAITLPGHIYFPLVGAVLVLSAVQMARGALGRGPQAAAPRHPPFLAALLTGAGIGLISGVTGTGGGVFLAPVILIMGWASARQTAAITAVYNLVNSSAALIGAHRLWDQLPTALPWWMGAVVLGGTLGAALGARYLPERGLRAILALLLGVSGLRMLG